MAAVAEPMGARDSSRFARRGGYVKVHVSKIGHKTEAVAIKSLMPYTIAYLEV